ncbi:2-hydroxy-3-oxopropionate reductase [Klebsiella pneumoniae]|nr:2-(hydroxymethyl)glutarate dehydrogenase [Klebsiella pneumoniae]SWB94841.1 2-hydroxy-3-oxopropionate reductase [Klebsiella pneumoniae]SXA12780.1 2-hydroxy-3-oxopropionate reductase [Klebsiella pneumoniae]SXA21408.1 2-hydroxy-3-oxopropionate reductase [Klebsiella pneumoniae]SXA38925.1 2-hydroxy-3-oxopropionate reductase [Klebsiella pneumoniae]
MSTLPKVAVLGLGAMGHAFASNLLKNGFTVAGWNRSPARGEDLQAHGLSLHATPQQAVADAEVIISMLADGEATLEVLAQIAPACQPQAIYCQMGTIGLPETRQAIALLRELQPAMTYIDAPVSGTKAPAEKAQILVLASGDREKGAAAEPVFAAISRGTQWFGEAGNSQKMKLVLNAWLISISETRRHRQRAVYPADAAGACPERCPAGAFPGRAAHHAGAGNHRRTVAAGGGRGICRRGFVCGISVAVAVVKSVVSYPRQERSGHGGHLSWRMGHQFESTVR